MRFLRRFSRAKDGATAIEYGLMAALISVACIIAFQMLGLNLAEVFWTLANTIGGALSPH